VFLGVGSGEAIAINETVNVRQYPPLKQAQTRTKPNISGLRGAIQATMGMESSRPGLCVELANWEPSGKRQIVI
jgi:hypothetical protein